MFINYILLKSHSWKGLISAMSEWQVVFFSVLPITELRASIPFALAAGLPPLKVYLLAVLGNLLPIFPLLLLLGPVSEFICRYPIIGKIFDNILNRSRSKGKKISKYGYIGLAFFVAIPLPGTGVWTGSLISWLLGMKIKASALAMSVGVCISGMIVTLATIGIIKTIVLTEMQILLAVVIVGILFWKLYKRR